MRALIAIGAALVISSPGPLAGSAVADPLTPAKFVEAVDTKLQERTSVQRKQLEVSWLFAQLPSPGDRQEARRLLRERFFPEARMLAREQYKLLHETRSVDNLQKLQDSLTGAMEALGSTAPSLVSAPTAQLGREVTRRALETLDKSLETKLQADVKEILAAGDEKLDKKKLIANLAEIKSVVDNPGKAAVLVDAILLAPETLSKDLKEKIANKINDAARNFRKASDGLIGQQKTFFETVRNTQETINVGLTEINGKIQEVNDKLASNRAKLQYADKANDFATYVSLIKENSEYLEANGIRLAFMKRTIYGDMTAEKVLNASEQLHVFGEKAGQVLAKREELVTSVRSYADLMSQFGEIVAGSGLLSGPDAANVAKGVKIAQAAQGFAANIAGGNYIGAVMGVSGLFGGGGAFGGVDANAARHQELMQTQRQILAGIDKILDGQKVLAQGIGDLLDGQKKIMDGLLQISAQIEHNQQELRGRFDELERRISDLQVLFVADLSSNLKSCTNIKRRLLGKNDYEDIKDFFNNDKDNRVALSGCMKGLHDSILSLSLTSDSFPNGLEPLFRLSVNSTVTANKTEDDRFRKQSFQCLAFFEASHPDKANRLTAIRKFFSPSPDVLSLGREGLSDPFPDHALSSAFGDILNHKMVLLAAEAALVAHPFTEMRNGRGIFVAPGELPKFNYANGPTGFSQYVGRERLQKALLLVDLAVAQQAMMSGDGLLFSLDRAVRGNDAKLKAQAVELLRSQPFLARNYVRFALRKDSVSSPTVSVLYREALKSNSIAMLNGIAGGYEFNHADETQGIDKRDSCGGEYGIIPKGWSLKLGECLYVPLPTADDFASGRFEFTSPFVALVEVRKRLTEALFGYEFADRKAGDSDKWAIPDKTWTYAVLNPLL